MNKQRTGTAIVIEGKTYELVDLKKYQQLADKAKAWDEFQGYFDSAVSEEGYVSDTDENIVTTIQSIRMNHQFEIEEEL